MVAGAEPAAASPTEPAVPAQVYYEEELPADFWDREDAPVADDTPPPDAGAGYADTNDADINDAATNDAATKYANHAANPASLQEDPRFVALTQLFPGKIIDWQLQDTPKDTDDEGNDDVDLPESDITEDETEGALD